MDNAAVLRKQFWDEDKKKGGLIHKQYDEIKHVLMENDYNWACKMNHLLKVHAINNVPFYRQYSESDAFPVLDKLQILENYEEHRAKKGFKEPLHVSHTSGSTGIPFAVEQDYVKRQRTIADLQVFGELCSYPIREKMVFFRVLNDKIVRSQEQEDRENIYYVDSTDLSPSGIQKMIDIIISRQPLIIFSYSSTLIELGKYVISRGIASDRFSLKSVLAGGEGLADCDRKMLQDAFGCRVYRRYSDMELGILGQDDGNGGAYILNWGSYFFECLKLNSDSPAENGEVGRIVITDLFNYAFPMIRYDTGDLGIMKTNSDGGLPVLTEIYGRIRDCVYATDGKMISPAKISVMMWGIKGIKQWQFIQEKKTEYLLKIITDNKLSINQYAILGDLKRVLGSDSKVIIQFVDEIPVLASNKRRAVICNVDNV